MTCVHVHVDYHLCTIHHVYIALYLSAAIGDTDSPDISILTASDLAGFEVGVEWKTNDLLPKIINTAYLKKSCK